MASNLEFGLLPAEQPHAIGQACDEIIEGKLHEYLIKAVPAPQPI